MRQTQHILCTKFTDADYTSTWLLHIGLIYFAGHMCYYFGGSNDYVVYFYHCLVAVTHS